MKKLLLAVVAAGFAANFSAYGAKSKGKIKDRVVAIRMYRKDGTVTTLAVKDQIEEASKHAVS